MSYPEPRDDALRQRYTDLLPDESADPALTHLIRDLDALANHPAPARAQARVAQQLHIAIQEKAEAVVQSAAPASSREDPRRRLLMLIPARWSTTRRPDRLGGKKPRRALRALIAASIALIAVVAITGGGAFAISRIDPGLAFQLGIPVATGPEYTKLEITHTVGDRTITVSRAAFTAEKVIIGYTYDFPGDSTDSSGVCALSLTSDQADSLREFAEDHLGQGVSNGVAHGSTVMYFAVERLDSSRQERHLRLTLHPCEGLAASQVVAFDFALPVQR